MMSRSRTRTEPDPEIHLPAGGWAPRRYQIPAWNFLARGGKRAALKWHRRSGKDATALHWTTIAAHQRPGVYWHMLPTLRQGRRVIWEGLDLDGNRVLDAWPGWRAPGALAPGRTVLGVVKAIRHDEMKLETWFGSVWYVVGSDNYDALMGTNPVGVVFSEFALTDPLAWDYVRPILAENGGWAVFCWTPRGRNHASRLYKLAEENPDEWFAQQLTVDDTGTIAAEAIESERRAGMSEATILQEFWCSEDAPLEGAYWSDQLVAAATEGRIGRVAFDPALKVDTWWDLGHTDSTAIWFVQRAMNEVHLIDYHEANGKPLEHYAQVLHALAHERKFVYGEHAWPHDGGARSLASKGRPLSSLWADLGFSAHVHPAYDVMVSIQRARQVLPRCWFDAAKCQAGLDALRAYRKDVDEDHSIDGRPHYKPQPRHDWASHGADAFRLGCMAISSAADTAPKAPSRSRYSGRVGPASGWAA